MMNNKMNKLAIVLVAILIFCWNFVLGSARNVPLTGIKELTFDASSNSAAKYIAFLSDLRAKLKRDEYREIPVLRAKVEVNSDDRYILATLKGKKSSITVALDVINAQVLGFKFDKNSYFFNDIAKEIFESKRIFGETTKARLPYGGSYQAMSGAGANRENVTLGISQLNEAIAQLVKYPTTHPKSDISSHLLLVVQMVSEATRFKYIQQKLVDNFFDDFSPKGDVISLENNWVTLSGAIQTSKSDSFAPIQLQDENDKPYKVSTVSAVKDKMGVLLAKENVRSMSWPCSLDLISKLLSVF